MKRVVTGFNRFSDCTYRREMTDHATNCSRTTGRLSSILDNLEQASSEKKGQIIM